MPTKTVFLDTQIFLHYRAIRDIDWCDLCHSERVSIIIAPIVIEELDKKKIDRDQKIKKRAARAIKEISELLEASPNGLSAVLRSGVELCFYPNEPMEFDVYSLDASHPDDRLIATLLSYQKRDQSLDCMLISEDLGCRLKAKARHIALGRMPESAKLTEEPDPNEQRIRELEEENRQLKLGTPKLCLAFLDKSHATHYSIKVDTSPPSDLATLSQIKRRHPKLLSPSRNYFRIESASPIRTQAPVQHLKTNSTTSIDEYNSDLDKYYNDYANYYGKESARQIQERHSIQLDFMVINDGCAPAQDVKVIISLPGDLIVHNRKSHPVRHDKPRAPEKPMRMLADMKSLSDELNMGPPLIQALDSIFKRNISTTENEIDIKQNIENCSISVLYSIKFLQHGFNENIPSIWIFFSPEILQSFSINYQIHASNLRSPAQGKLHVVINQAN